VRIVVTEFMDADAVASLAAAHDTRYLPDIGRPARTRSPRKRRSAGRAGRAQPDAGARRAARRRAEAARGRRLGVGLDNIDVQACEARGHRGDPGDSARTRRRSREYVIADGDADAARRVPLDRRRSRQGKLAATRSRRGARSPARRSA
jgi:(S)-sulfolactate dehydrogenase